ncbi:DUF362 domain-containing protein [Deltaproteobacteria bacterium OttesenSCG-928-K17]|nr:DUF362 domain-containing protein [Deltaproteobacteria bacterium OttesenSCG-928-K17]
MDRRDFLKTMGLTAAGAVISASVPSALRAAEKTGPAAGKAQVFFTSDISGAGLKKLYARVNQNLSGRIAVKLHTGEPNGPYILKREMVKDLMGVIPNAAIVETNVFYGGPRTTTEGHREVLKTNGWTFAPVDILDADGDVNLPVPGGKWFKEIAMGKNIVNYDSMLVLTHFKGHTLGGFGGSLKNMAIGCASGKAGKKQLHQSGDKQWGHTGERFMENMVESGKALTNYFGPKMAYINVMNNMSVDCDCTGLSAEPPTLADIGILASTDVLAIDQACIDMVYALPEGERRHLVERIESRQGLRQLSYMDEMNMGSRQYDLIGLD